MKRVLLIVGVLALLGGGAYWLLRDGDRKIPDTAPAAAPKVGSCWKVDAAGVKAAFPWAGGPVDCAAAHTVEVFHVGQAGKDLLHRLDDAEGEDIKITQNLLYAQARRACVVEGTAFLGGNWHESRIQILASWIAPATDGFFGCAVAPVTGPAGDEFTAREGSLAKAGPTLPIACISSLKYVECTAPHDGEYSGSYSIAPMDAPYDETAVRNASAKGCTTVGLRYLGLSETGDRADLSSAAVGPKTGSDWLGSDQTFACYLMSAKPLKASIAKLGAGPLPLA
ncbi:septum formation family protein [Dactylosporangium sp. NPDC005555]|uniref:septum formation family protein n=1 Tax=Dactylosporangium sp. NPDC005555 TaxID=3154889 RepID=UPI0033AF39FF